MLAELHLSQLKEKCRSSCRKNLLQRRIIFLGSKICILYLAISQFLHPFISSIKLIKFYFLDNAKSKLDSELGPSCDPSKIKLHQDNPGQSENGLTMDEVRNLVGQPSDLKYVDVDKQSFYCLDGRVNKEILGTPGGDAGEFILALETYARLTGNRDLDDDSIVSYRVCDLKFKG